MQYRNDRIRGITIPGLGLGRRSLENRISRLRGKAGETLGPDTNLIRSIRGKGYQLTEPLQLLD